MNFLYQKNHILLRRARREDCLRLAAVLRKEDRAELAASHPAKEPQELLVQFFKRSSACFVLEYRGEPAALFGVAPDVWMGRRACVWLLTGRRVRRIAKTFVRVARALLAGALRRYEELYNFADGRYTAALRFIRRLGGTFDGTVCQTACAPFLRFTFRRK